MTGQRAGTWPANEGDEYRLCYCGAPLGEHKPVDPRVAAIRANELVGQNSCTAIDECMGDADLTDFLNEEEITTPEAAVKWAIKHELQYLEVGLNQRWGEDDDEQLVQYNKFKAKAKEFLGE